MAGEDPSSRFPVKRCWIKLKWETSSRLTVETLGWLPDLTGAVVSNLCFIVSLTQLKDSPRVSHSVPGTKAVSVIQE